MNTNNTENSKNPDPNMPLDSDEEDVENLTIVPFKTQLTQQNSFINVIINYLFYFEEIRKFFETEEPTLNDNFRLIYEIQSVLEQMRKLTSPKYYKNTVKDRRQIDSSYIKHELKYQFKNLFFNAQQSGDACTVLNIFLNALHVYFLDEEDILAEQKNKCLNKNCIPHNLAYIDIASQIYCTQCGKKGTLYKYPFNTYYYTIDTNAILSYIYEKELINENYMESINKIFEIEKIIFENNLNNNKEIEDFKCDCRLKNIKNIKNDLLMLQSHKYFAVNLLWNKPPKFEDSCKIFLTIPQKFSTSQLFHIFNDQDIKNYILYGMIVVKNNQNVSFFLNFDNLDEYYENLEWYYCNDTETKIFSSYKEVIEWNVIYDYYPTLLFYINLDKIKFNDNLKFSEEEINSLLHHASLVDNVNSITYTNRKLFSNILRPTNEKMHKSYDKTIYNKVNKNKEVDTSKGKKYNFVEELAKERERESLLFTEFNLRNNDNKPKIVKRPENLQKLTKSKDNCIFAKNMKFETFRDHPYNLEANWVCGNCENINNPSTFECIKCKLIDMKIFAKIEEKKNNLEKNNNNNKAKTTRFNNNFYNKKKYNRNIEYDQYTKKCINCGQYYVNKCNKCSKILENKTTFSKIRDENNMKLVHFVYNRINKPVINREKSSEKNMFMNSPPHEWKCLICNNFNSAERDYCTRCKKNK